jgi:hypothetical protein
VAQLDIDCAMAIKNISPKKGSEILPVGTLDSEIGNSWNLGSAEPYLPSWQAVHLTDDARKQTSPSHPARLARRVAVLVVLAHLTPAGLLNVSSVRSSPKNSPGPPVDVGMGRRILGGDHIPRSAYRVGQTLVSTGGV